ncbi:UNVERIFIED_CONTAM: hypothetical protein FKN15_032294 [Acipenser sinensis]
MSVTEAGGTASQDGKAYPLQIYPRLAAESSPCCTLTVPKSATAAAVIQDVAVQLELDPSKCYVLAEVKECGGEEWVLEASDLPVQRVLLWPRRAHQEHPQSEGYYFLLQERNADGSIRYVHLPVVCQEKEARRLTARGFLPPKQADFDDLCNLPHLTEEAILDNLKNRFHKHNIYTYAGSILLAINPFKFLPIYNPKYVKMYDNHQLGKLEPHIFAIADVAYHAMLRKHVNQCIVISGESGSGKTQSTNFLIHCLTALSQKGYASGVERTILGAGPVLEAFGNAKTAYNNNSSRFGKFIQAFGNAKTAYNNNSSRFGKFIQVNYLESGVVRGAVVEKYLLEKSRLVSREKNERNYHVFYYLLLGASEEERKEFKLLQPDDYLYLKQQNFKIEDGEDLRHDFERLQQAMEMVGFLPSTKKQIFSVLSAILYLGNVSYQKKSSGRDEGLEVGPPEVLNTLSELLKYCDGGFRIFSVLSAILYLGNVSYQKKSSGRDEGLEVGPPEVLNTLSELLKVREEMLVEALTKRKTVTVNEKLILPYSLNEAITARDSMAKSLYSALFDWIVLRINHALLNKKDMEESVTCLSIGVLDIFGFEDFETNSFEQFCINYANEQLQYYFNQHIFKLEQLQYYFNQHIFKLEQEEYQSEGISWHNIDYTDNVGCIHLISKKPTGLFHLLDEESNFPHATNKTLLAKFKQQHDGNQFFVGTPVMEPAFIIRHFAGKVKYQIKDFREKNTDYMRPDIVALLRSSDRAYIRELVGMDPVAVFRWAILRAAIRGIAAFCEAGRRWAAKTAGVVRRGSRVPLGELQRANTPVEKMYRDMHAQIIRSIKGLPWDGEDPRKLLQSWSRLQHPRDHFLKNKSTKQKQLIPKNLLDTKSLKHIVSRTLHDRTTKSLLHLHKKKKPPSISAQFQTSLSKLMETLGRAEPFFIRCIRSNSEKMELRFDDTLVLQQLRYTGMLETVRIRHSGYSAKYTFQEFMEQFRVLLPKNSCTSQEEISALFEKMGFNKNNYQIGKTKCLVCLTECSFLCPGPPQHPGHPSPKARKNPDIKISNAPPCSEQWHTSLQREITNTNELKELDEFLRNQVNDVRSRGKQLSDTENIFIMATMQFRENIKTMYSRQNQPANIRYRNLMKNYQLKVASLAGEKQKAEVQLVVNLFQSVLDGFIRAEIKKEEAEPAKSEKRMGHVLSSYQVNIIQSCDQCTSYIFAMEKALICSYCKIICHKKCISKIQNECTSYCVMKNETEAGSRHFGVRVCALTSERNPVPIVLEILLEHVEMNGLYTEGIYRKSGSANRMKELWQRLEADPTAVNLEEYPIHAVTGILKQWLRELPDPLMTFTYYNDFLHASEKRMGHVLSSYQVNIIQSCDQCTSYIFAMEKALICSYCKIICHKKCISKIQNECTSYCVMKNETEAGSRHFGVRVCALTSERNPVPIVLEILLEHVEMNGLYTEGIYRKSGSANRMKELWQRLEADPTAVNLEEYPIHAVTGILKQWLRELPDPLMTFTYYNDFLHAVEMPGKQEQLQAIYRILEQLPQANYNTLERLVFHLVRVAKEEPHNRMTPNALAIVYAPCILRCPDNADPLTSMKDVAKTTMTCKAFGKTEIAPSCQASQVLPAQFQSAAGAVKLQPPPAHGPAKRLGKQKSHPVAKPPRSFLHNSRALLVQSNSSLPPPTVRSSSATLHGTKLPQRAPTMPTSNIKLPPGILTRTSSQTLPVRNAVVLRLVKGREQPAQRKDSIQSVYVVPGQDPFPAQPRPVDCHPSAAVCRRFSDPDIPYTD